MSITSRELNYLIWRYMQESGLPRSTYVFQDETEANALDASYASVTPVGLLVNVFQKGLQYMEIESTLEADGGVRPSPPVFNLFSDQVARKIDQLADEEPPEEDELPPQDVTPDSAAPPQQQIQSIEQPAEENEEQPEQTDVTMNDASPESIHSLPAEPAAIEPLPAPTPTHTHTHTTARKHSIEDDGDEEQQQESTKAQTAPVEDEPKRVKTSHVRTTSTATANLFQQPPHVPTKPTQSSSASEPIHEVTKVKSESLSSAAPTKSRSKTIYLAGVSAAVDSAWSPDGTKLAVSTSSSTVFLYCFSNSTSEPVSEVQITLNAIEEISSLALSANMLAIGTFSGTAQLWSITGEKPKLEKTLRGLREAPILSLEFVISEGKLLLAAIDCLRNAAVWSCAEAETPLAFLVPDASDCTDDELSADIKNSISDLQVLTAMKAIATTTGRNGTIDVYDLARVSKGGQIQPLYSLKGHTRAVNVLRYVSKSGILISGSQDSSIRIWDLNSRSERFLLEGHNTGVIALKVYEREAEESQVMVSGDVAGRLRVWDLTTGTMLARIEYSYPVFAFDILKRHINEHNTNNGDGSSSSSSSSSSIHLMRIVTGSKDGIINTWKLNSAGDGHKLHAQSIGSGMGGVTAVSLCCDSTTGESRLAVIARGKSCIINESS
ncbi:WD40-repeat-containing domain protein [Myxozyma melibiosi]|uniref:WD40-repeat-containing domain protein n=1 Tax=Myxozyma melibiosi TaxID=54550 RepID=A0ABR1F263_9ASCO